MAPARKSQLLALMILAILPWTAVCSPSGVEVIATAWTSRLFNCDAFRAATRALLAAEGWAELAAGRDAAADDSVVTCRSIAMSWQSAARLQVRRPRACHGMRRKRMPGCVGRRGRIQSPRLRGILLTLVRGATLGLRLK